jgi:L-fuconolactonase
MKHFDFEIIDSHCHLWDLKLAKERWISPEWGDMFRTFEPQDIKATSATVPVAGAIAIECGTFPEENEALARVATESPFIRGYCPHVDLESSDLEDQLDTWRARPKCVGVRMRFEGHEDPSILRCPSIIDGLKRVAERGLVFEYLVRTHHLHDIVRIHEQIPNLAAVIEHMAKPDYAQSSDRREWEAGMEAVAKHTNIPCKLSLSPRGENVGGLLAKPKPGWTAGAIRPYAQFVIERFGAKRLMWGSDYPISLLTSDYQGTWNALLDAVGELPSDAAKGIFRDNALKFYGV